MWCSTPSSRAHERRRVLKEHIWEPVDAVYDGWCIQITYQNELGEEFVYTTCDELMNSEEHSGLRAMCWPRCSGDWPGCRAGCCAYNAMLEMWSAQEKEYSTMPPMDPFSFMLNHYCSIDDNNYYVEEFDTLDGAHWEIAIDVDEQLLDMLDEETKGEEYE